MRWAITACFCRPARAARIPGWSLPALAPQTERLRFLVAVRPGLQSPTVAARMTATLDRVSQGRFVDQRRHRRRPGRNKGDGLFLSHNDRYDLTREFLEIYARAVARRERRLFRQAPSSRGGQAAVPAVPGPASGALFWRLVRRGHRCRGAAGRQISDLGRAAGCRGREKSPSSPRPREHAGESLFRHPPARLSCAKRRKKAWRAATS